VLRRFKDIDTLLITREVSSILDSMTSDPPSKATDAVLVQSEPVPSDAPQVKGIDWAGLPDEQRAILASFVQDMAGQGFQSSAIGDAIRIINDMVRLEISQCL